MARMPISQTAALLAAMCCGATFAAAQTSLEYQVKAAYLYNFAKFVTWPGGDASGSLTICVIGKDPFGSILDDTVRGKNVRGQPIVIHRMPAGSHAVGCQIVFTGFSNDLCRIHATQPDWDGTLLVGEGDEFAKCGGMIGLTLKEGRVHFDINLESVTKAHLEVSSKLLEVATIVPVAIRK